MSERGWVTVENAIEICRSPEDVFDYLTDITKEVEWNPRTRRVEKLTPGPFTFLGFRFRPRRARRKDGVQFTAFLPAISKDALKRISTEVRSWRLHRWVNSDGPEIARLINPKIRGWMAYYGAFYPSALYPVLRRINTYLMRWVMNKYRKWRTWKKATRALMDAAATRPRYFAHWAWVKPAAR